MRVPLSDGHFAEIREDFKAGDRRRAKEAVVIRIEEDGSRELNLAFEENAKRALLRQLITAWDVSPTLPKDTGKDEAEALFDDLPDDDFSALLEAVTPVYDKIMERGQDPKRRKTVRGAVVS